MENNVSVIIPAYKNTTLLLRNLQNNYPLIKDCEIIIINDDPSTPLKPYLKKYPDIKVIENEKNLGFSRAINKGIAIADRDYLLLLNTDVVIKQINLQKLMAVFIEKKQLFAVSFYQMQNAGIVSGKNRVYWQKGMFNHQRAHNLMSGITAWAEGGAGIFSKKILQQMGGFDSLYSPFYWEDIDLCYRAWKMGFEIIFDPETQVEHQHESTIGKYFTDKIKTTALRNQFVFIWKNITDKELIDEHLKMLPKVFLSLIKDTGFTAGKSFFQAVLLLPEILKKRQEQKKGYQKTDQEILAMFNNTSLRGTK